MDSPKQNDMEQAPIDAADLVTAAQTSAQAFALCLAQKLTLPETLAQALTQDHGGEALIIALRALGADGDEVQQISKLLCDTLTEGQLVWRRALCLCISQPLAQMILQAMMHTHRQTLAGPQNTTDTVQQQQQSLSA
jgi:hypothetical protein